MCHLPPGSLRKQVLEALACQANLPGQGALGLLRLGLCLPLPEGHFVPLSPQVALLLLQLLQPHSQPVALMSPLLG